MICRQSLFAGNLSPSPKPAPRAPSGLVCNGVRFDPPPRGSPWDQRTTSRRDEPSVVMRRGVDHSHSAWNYELRSQMLLVRGHGGTDWMFVGPAQREMRVEMMFEHHRGSFSQTQRPCLRLVVLGLAVSWVDYGGERGAPLGLFFGGFWIIPFYPFRFRGKSGL